MLVQLTEFLKKNNALSKTYRGTVVATDELEDIKIGRIKVTIDSVLTGDTSALPWIYQKTPNGNGFSVPAIGSEVTIEFPYEDIYSGFYTGSFQSENTHDGFFDEDYPASWGVNDGEGTSLKINKAKRFLEFIHASGAQFSIEKDSTITLQSDSQIVFQSADLQTKFILDMVTGEVKFLPAAGTTLGGGKVTLDPRQLIINSDVVAETITGGKKTVVGGGYSVAVAQSLSETVGGDKLSTVLGKITELVGIGAVRTYGGLPGTDTISDTVVMGNVVKEIFLGNYEINVLAGNITISTLAGFLKVGSPSSLTSVLGIIVQLGGIGGLPVARLGDQVIGVGNLGAPVMSNILLGSFKVFAS